MYSAHVIGKYHRAKADKGSRALAVLCPICNTRLTGEAPWLQHVNSADHRAKAQASGASPSVHPRDPSNPKAILCLICKRSIPQPDWNAHLVGDVHQRIQRNAQYLSQYEQAELGKHGVVISHGSGGLDLGVVSVEGVERGLQRQLTVTLDAFAPAMSISGVDIFPGVVNKSSSFSASTSQPGRRLEPGSSTAINITFSQDHRGRFQDRLEVTFKILSTERTFVISRSLRAVVGNAADHDLLRPTAPYVRRRRAQWNHDGTVVEGERPPALTTVQWAKKLLPSLIPSALANILNNHNTEVLNQVRAQFPPAFENATHGQWFRVLLWVEESRMVEDLRMYDMEGAQFMGQGSLYTLPVPGLSEKRPSVVRGDIILAQVGGGGHTHRGFVHFVHQDDIGVSFNASFQVGAQYTVRFQYNRTPIRRQHQALLASSAISQRLLFPIPGIEGLAQAIAPTQYPLTLYNAQIATNAAQLQAVKSILQLRTRAAPFIVFGPPGTGKTITMVEAIRQILRRQPDAHILACAPSNSAADLIAQRLNALDTSQLFRCNAVFRDPQSLPVDLIPYTYQRNNLYTLPPVAVLQTYQVIVTTCGNASFAYNIGIPVGHFTHIFIDEAGQGSEPEVLTAINTVATLETHVVLSGDPKQLGPVIRSSVARELGLGKSYLERLMEMAVYDLQTGRGRSFVKLVDNFRSHQAILDYPNAQFYNNELQVCGASTTIDALLGSPVLVSPRWPVVFHHISGENERESTSPSYFNIDEATEVVDYIKNLLKDRQHPIRAEDIGIITPYYAQVRKIRLLLRHEHIEGTKVGSVEEFQGQERKVIIVSTVRSTRDLLSYDAKFTLGFVSNPRRFNVAITRAQALLVVIGDTFVLSIDPLWRAFMNYVHLHNGWRGDAPIWDTSAPVQMDGNYAAEIRDAAAVDVEAFMARLGLDDDDDAEGQANMERPFQEAE